MTLTEWIDRAAAEFDLFGFDSMDCHAEAVRLFHDQDDGQPWDHGRVYDPEQCVRDYMERQCG